jgi:hypothetical protein
LDLLIDGSGCETPEGGFSVAIKINQGVMLTIGRVESVGVVQTSEWVTSVVGSVIVLLSTSVRSLKVQFCLIDKSHDLDVVWGLDEL